MKQNNAITGIVIRSTGSNYIVETSDGEKIECKLRGRFRLKGYKTTNPIAVGDVVKCSYVSKDDVYLINHIEERKNCIYRKATNLSKQIHLIATNIDQSVLVVTITQPFTSTGFIDRFLVCSESFFVPSILVFNKIDIYENDDWALFEEYKKIYENAGYKILTVSAKEGTNIEELKSILKDKITLFSGHSGVGKSHLIKAIEPSLNPRIGEISMYHEKGKHTTTFAEMYNLSFGGKIIDTPGIKEFGLVNIELWELSHWFPEFKKYINNCKFNNCTHINEPDCAVMAALREGHIPHSRYSSYLSIFQQLTEEQELLK